MNFQKSGGTPGVQRNYLAARDWKSGLISTYVYVYVYLFIHPLYIDIIIKNTHRWVLKAIFKSFIVVKLSSLGFSTVVICILVCPPSPEGIICLYSWWVLVAPQWAFPLVNKVQVRLIGWDEATQVMPRVSRSSHPGWHSVVSWAGTKPRLCRVFRVYLALLGSYGLKIAQNSLIALKIAPFGPPNSKMGCCFKIGQVLADLWPIYRDQKSRLF